MYRRNFWPTTSEAAELLILLMQQISTSPNQCCYFILQMKCSPYYYSTISTRTKCKKTDRGLRPLASCCVVNNRSNVAINRMLQSRSVFRMSNAGLWETTKPMINDCRKPYRRTAWSNLIHCTFTRSFRSSGSAMYFLYTFLCNIPHTLSSTGCQRWANYTTICNWITNYKLQWCRVIKLQITNYNWRNGEITKSQISNCKLLQITNYKFRFNSLQVCSMVFLWQ